MNWQTLRSAALSVCCGALLWIACAQAFNLLFVPPEFRWVSAASILTSATKGALMALAIEAIIRRVNYALVSLPLSCGAVFLIAGGFVCAVAFRFLRAPDPEALLVFGLLGMVIALLYWSGRMIGRRVRFLLAGGQGEAARCLH